MPTKQTNQYNFDPAVVSEEINRHWKAFMDNLKVKRCVIGISGGKDSTVVAWIAAKLFGPKNVYGVTMPCNGGQDPEAQQVINTLGIKQVNVDVGDSFNILINKIGESVEIKSDTIINLPPRLRMATLYAVAQSVNGMVINTSNRSEDDVGYATLGGDDLGGYAPIQDLTVTEVIALGEYLGIPDELIHKVPADGLQAKTDEARLGFKYADLDRFIRYDEGSDAFKAKILKKYRANKFKLNMIRLTGPAFNFPDYVRATSFLQVG